MTYSSLFSRAPTTASQCMCVCVQALGGPLYVPAGACLPLKACAALPGEAPAVCCVILSGACLGRPFPHSARCAVKHGVGEDGEKRQKGPILSTLHGLDSRDISPTPKPFQSSVHFLQHLCCGNLLHNVHSLLFTGEAPLQSICSFPPFHSFFTESSFSPPCAFQFNSISYRIRSRWCRCHHRGSMETFLTYLRDQTV